MIRLLTFVLAIASASTAWARPGYTPAPTFSGPHPAVVRVVVPERDGTAYGSGALVAINESSGLVLTNWHVVRGAAGPITVVFSDGFRSGAYLLRTDRDWDLAALAIRRPRVRPITLSNQAPQQGEALTIAGYGSGSYRAVTGRLTQYVSPGGNRPFEMIELDAPARDGDSGGPIFNARGELAGVLFGSAFGRTTGSYCGRLRWFLNSVDGDFRRISAQAMLAQQSRASPPPVASINSPRPTNLQLASGEGPGVSAIGEESVAQLSPPPRLGEQPINSPFISREQPIGSPLPWEEGPGVRASDGQTMAPLPGYSSSAPSQAQPAPMPAASVPDPSPGPLPNTDQIKTILAAIGVIAVLCHALRLLGRAVG